MTAPRHPRTTCFGLILACSLLLTVTGAAGAQSTPGTVDTSFGGGFVTAVGDASTARAMAVDSAGRVVAVGDYSDHWVIVRFTAAGALDTTFGSAGQVILFGQGAGDWALDVAIQTVQTEEKIIVVGLGGIFDDQQFTIVRLNADGSMDSTFGTNGIVQTEITRYGSNAYAVAAQPDGKIVVAGFSFNRYHGTDRTALTIARYNVDGSLDTQTFGTPNSKKDVKRGAPPHKGYLIDDISPETNEGVFPGGIALQADGKIVLAGFSGQSYLTYQPFEGWTIARYNSDGSVDSSFGIGGKVIAESLPGFDKQQAKGVAIQSDGRILVSGRGWNIGGDFDAVVMRYEANGSVDETFGAGGLARSWLTEEEDHGGQLAIQSNGKIVVANKYLSDMAAFRFNPDGTPDTSFGTSGTGLSDLVGAYPGSTELVFSLALDANGGIFVGGSSAGLGLAITKFHP